MVIGLPVGFVGAAESKQALRESGLPAVSNTSEKGGSAVAAGHQHQERQQHQRQPLHDDAHLHKAV